MASSIVGIATSRQDSAVTSHPITLPTGSVGDYLLLLFVHRDATISASASSWGVPFYSLPGTSGDFKGSFYNYRVVTTLPAITVTTSAPAESAAIVYRWSGTAGTNSIQQTGASGTSSSPNAGFLLPYPAWPGGFGQQLYFAVYDGAVTRSAWPTDYTLGQTAVESVGASADLGVASAIKLVTTSESPGSWALSGSAGWRGIVFLLEDLANCTFKKNNVGCC